MFKMVGICWRVQVYIVRQQWQKLGNSPITRPRNITRCVPDKEAGEEERSTEDATTTI